MDYSRQTEKEIVNSLINKDEMSLHKFIKNYHKRIFGFIHKRIYKKEVAEEITQDVFIEFLESLRDFRFQCSLKTMLYTIARNKAVDHMRKKKLKQILFSHLPQFMVEGLAHIVLDDEIERKELQSELDKTFAALPHDYRLILRLKYIEEKSVKEISDYLFRTFKSTESLLYRARKAFINLYAHKS